MANQMSAPSKTAFVKACEKTFGNYLYNNGYELIEKSITGKSARMLFRSSSFPRIIEIENQYDPRDYGFFMNIKFPTYSKSSIIISIPLQEQDSKCMFVRKAFEAVTANHDIIEMIKGLKWDDGISIGSSRRESNQSL